MVRDPEHDNQRHYTHSSMIEHELLGVYKIQCVFRRRTPITVGLVNNSSIVASFSVLENEPTFLAKFGDDFR